MDQHELERAQNAKSVMDQISPSFCGLKWRHATINFGSGAVKSCCHAPFRKVEIANDSEGLQLHDTVQDRQERKEMLSGGRPAACNDCWRIEDQGHLSDRIFWSSKFWYDHKENYQQFSAQESAEAPTWIELNFSNVCQLKCSYCSPIYSTKWLNEIKTFGPYPTLPAHNDLRYLQSVDFNEKYDPSLLLEKFWPWFEKNLPQLKLLKITGGEPLLSPETFKVFDYILAHPQPALHLSINSNCSIPSDQWALFLQKLQLLKQHNAINDFYLHPSLDALGAQAEYIRHGLNFKLFDGNINQYLSQGLGNLIFICSLNNLSLGSLLTYWKYVLNFKKIYYHTGKWVSLTTEIVHGPPWQNINILPKEFKRFIQQTLVFADENKDRGQGGYSTVEILGLKKALEMMDQKSENELLAKRNFYRFFSEHDKRRNTNLLNVFPELQDFYWNCKKLDDKSLLEETRC